MADDTTIRFKVDGEAYEVDLSDLDGLERRAFRTTVGQSVEHALVASGTGEQDIIEVYAGLAWLIRRRTDKSVSYEQVLGGMSLGNIVFDDEAEDEGNPPA